LKEELAACRELVPIFMKRSKYLKGHYEVDLGLTFLFWEVYGGDEFYPLRENASFKDFKIQFSKLILTIKQAFLDTCINTDKSHRDEIIELTTFQLNEIKKKKTIEDLYTSLLIFFTKLCFLLIGRRPNNFSNRIKDNRASWSMNQHRHVQYTQTREQQFELFRDLLKNKKIEGLDFYKDEIKKYRSQKLLGENMLDWFKRLYPEKFFKIFDRIN
jgi:hypothetical protein